MLPARKVAWVAFSWALAAALTGCAQHPGLVRMPSADTAQAAVGRWSGRMALKLEAFGQEPAQGVNLAFDLQGHAQAGQLDLSTPLGTLIAQVRWQSAGAVLTTPEGQQSYDSLDALTQRVLGEPLPVQAILSWLDGRPAPQLPWLASPESSANSEPADSTPVRFTQANWLVDLSALPEGLLTARRQGNDAQRGASLKLRLER